MKKFYTLFSVFTVAVISIFSYRAATNGSANPPEFAYIPADTNLFIGGSIPADVIGDGQSPLKWQPLLAELQQELKYSPFPGTQKLEGFRLLRVFVEDARNSLVTVGDIETHTGIDPTRFQVVYLDGLYPVYRGHLSQPDQFEHYLDTLAHNAKLTFKTEKQGDQSYLTLPLSVGEARNIPFPPKLKLAIRHDEDSFTITVLDNSSSSDRLATRIAIREPAKSLADSGRIEKLEQSVQLEQGNFYAQVDFAGLVAGIMQQGDSPLAQDLGKIAPAKFSRLSEGCRQEFSQLAALVPRLNAMGRYSADDQQVMLDSNVRLIIKSALIKQTLKSVVRQTSKVTGHPAAAVGLGIDTDQLMPAWDSLRTAAMAAPTQCQQLERMKRGFGDGASVPLRMTLGAVAGIKGFHAAVYPTEKLQDAQLSIDALVAVNTEKPDSLATMFNQFVVPRLFGFGQPKMTTDGKVTDYRFDNHKVKLDLHARVKGSQVLFYSGEESAAAADKLKSVGGSSKSQQVAGVSVDTHYADSLVYMLPNPLFDRGGYGTEGPCIKKARLEAKFFRSPMQWKAGLVTDTQGLLLTGHVAVDKARGELPEKADIAGRYDFQVMNRSPFCMDPDMTGVQQINADGDGWFEWKQRRHKCALQRVEFDWARKDDDLTFKFTKKQRRRGCDKDWEDAHGSSYHDITCSWRPTREGANCIPNNGARGVVLKLIRKQGN